MQVNVRWKNLEISQAVRTHAERAVHGALGRFRDHVASVRVDLADVSGTNGGDKVCRIQVRGDRACEIIVTDAASDVYVAIHRAADRAEQSIAQMLAHACDPPNGSGSSPQ